MGDLNVDAIDSNHPSTKQLIDLLRSFGFELLAKTPTRFRNESRYWVQRVLQPAVVLVGVVGNLITIIVLTRRRMSSSTNTYLTALAVTDLAYLTCVYTVSYENHPGITGVEVPLVLAASGKNGHLDRRTCT
ncbi:uncharacterized protein LOC124370692, partial [Homalodisca vitripennis]|uniref:uncharacterized protein LOC124370692 n=1 Tax=Homalodisca vitripennis TaxID=197043 RepID=UPI001EEC6FED